MDLFDNTNYNFQVLLDTIGFIQGTTLAILLMVINKKQYQSNLCLGLFLFFLSLKLAWYISLSINIHDVYPELFLLPFNFTWLLLPLFCLYTQNISHLYRSKPSYWILIPGIISFFAQLIIFFLPFETKMLIFQSIWYSLIFTYLGVAYALAIGIWNLKLLNEHREDILNTYSYVKSKELQWARMFLIYFLITAFVTHILYAISPTNPNFKLLYSVFDLIAIYWVSYQGIKQRNIQQILSKEASFKLSQGDSSEFNQSLDNTEDREKLMQLIDNHMLASEIFIHTELTIVDLAKELGIHPKKISTAINTVREQNFNTYVNRFRIKKAEELLENQEYINLSIEGIGNEVGFQSKSAFYSAFKKETGTTPVKYKEKRVP